MRQVQQDTYFVPVIQNTPPLPSIDWSLIGQQAPVLLDTPAGVLPQADVILITWSPTEWAALEQVFCNSSGTMPYSEQNTAYWSGWQMYNWGMPPYSGSDPWTYWGYYRLVQIQGKNVLLFKSNTHYPWPGPTYLEEMVANLIAAVQPSLILSTGTAGGAQVYDHTGTVRVVQAATLHLPGVPQPDWPTYRNDWLANWSVLEAPNFDYLLFPVPTTESDLESIAEQFNQYYGTDYTLSQFDPNNLDMGDPIPLIYNMTPSGTSVLTTATFIVGNTDGNYANFACIEMDDAIVARACFKHTTLFGFVRNLSDPVSNAALPVDVQSNWGSALYNAYGFYTSFNSALTAWAIISGQLG